MNNPTSKQTAKKPRHEESKLQQACVRWFNYQYPNLILFSVKNSSKMGGKKTKHGIPLEAIIAKREGLVSGIADVLLLQPNHFFHGFFIEFKTDKGRQSESQKTFEKYCKEHGYKYLIIRNLDVFINEIKKYLMNGK